MTEELKPHQIAQLVNKLRDIATKYHAHGCLRELISREVVTALTQRPAAQTEREAFEAFVRRQPGFAAHLLYRRNFPGSERIGQYVSMEIEFAWEAWQVRASLPAPQRATPDHAAEIARLKAVIDQLERREILAVAQQATPEPVGEVVWIQPNHLQKARFAPHLCRVAPSRIAPDFVPLYPAQAKGGQ